MKNRFLDDILFVYPVVAVCSTILYSINGNFNYLKVMVGSIIMMAVTMLVKNIGGKVCKD